MDQYRGRKLEPRWEGPYRLSDVAHHGHSVRLVDLYSEKAVRVRASGLKERCHLDDLKDFPRRSKGCDGDMDVIKVLDEKGIYLYWRMRELSGLVLRLSQKLALSH